MHTRDLAYSTLNRLLSLYKGDIFIRICKEEIRGILSPRYTCFDSDKILKIITLFFEHNPFLKPEDVFIDSYINDMERFQLRIYKKFPESDYAKNDLRYGLLIDSSDVGLSSLRVRFYVYKLMCTNGLIIKCFERNLLSQSHVGKISEVKLAEGPTRSFELFPEISQKASNLISKANNYYIDGTGLIDFSQTDEDSILYLKNSLVL